MSTLQQKVNGLPTGLPQPNDFMTFHDPTGTCKRAQWSNIQENTPPPTIWRKIITDEVRIAFRSGEYLGYAPLSTASAHREDFIGLAIPRYGRIVYPEVIKLPWGSTAVQCVTSGSNATIYSTLEYGDETTLACFNATPNNQGVNCAVGYAHNFQRMVTLNGTEKGIRKGSWYLMHPSEGALVVLPIYEHLQYAASLLGFTWPTDVFWCGSDKVGDAGDKAYRLNIPNGNLLGTSKASSNGVLLMTKMVIGGSTPV